MQNSPSKDVARAAVSLSLSANREQEDILKTSLAKQGFRVAAVDYGGDFTSSIQRMVERTIIAAKREHVIRDTHGEEGSVAGACREALSQISLKAQGLGVGGKIGIARRGEHLSVATFFVIGLLHLDEVAIGLGHRAIARWDDEHHEQHRDQEDTI